MQTPSITVLMTVYNGMPFIQDAISALLQQTVQDFTILIVNNGSSDGTKEYLDTLASAHPNTCIVSPDAESAAEHQQTAAAHNAPLLCIVHLPETISRTAVLNKALDLVKDELIAVLDADDIPAPERLAAQRTFMKEHPDVALVGCDIVHIDRNGEIIDRESYPPTHSELVARMPLFNQFAHSGCVFRTAVAKELGGYPADITYAQDMGLWLAMLVANHKVASIPRPLAFIRVHPGQASQDAGKAANRAEEMLRLSHTMLAIPAFPRASRQLAYLRGAAALAATGKWERALRMAWQGFLTAPLLLPANPLLWQRIRCELARRLVK